MILTNKRIQELAGAFRLLLSRALPSISAQRAAILFNGLRPFVESYDEVMKPLQVREAAALKLEDEGEKDAALSQIRAEVDALNATAYEVPDPKVRLAQHDLPKAAKKDDLANTAGNGIIQATLAPEFFDLVDPDKEAAEDE